MFRSVHLHSQFPSLPLLSLFFFGSSHLLQMISTLFAAGLLLIPSANAFWRLPCAKPVLNARVDPIVYPGKASSHSHAIMGSNGASHHKALVKSLSDLSSQLLVSTLHLILCVVLTARRAKSRMTSPCIGFQSWYVAYLARNAFWK